MEAGGYAANGGRYAHYHRLVWWVHADSPALPLPTWAPWLPLFTQRDVIPLSQLEFLASGWGAIASHVMGFWYGWGFAPGRTEELKSPALTAQLPRHVMVNAAQQRMALSGRTARNSLIQPRTMGSIHRASSAGVKVVCRCSRQDRTSLLRGHFSNRERAFLMW